MRFKAILAEAARKRYPLSVMLFVISVLALPFLALGIVVAGLLAGVASIVEDVHDVSMHTVGFDLEWTEPDEEEEPLDEAEPPVEEEQPGQEE